MPVPVGFREAGRRPQPVVIEAERAGRFHGAVVDVGCGLGENAIYLVSQGHQVTGIDAAPAAIEQATQLAGERGVDLEFAVADATSLAGFEGRFDYGTIGTVTNLAARLCGEAKPGYHCLDEDARHAYAAALHRATRPDGLLTLFCFPAASTGLAATMGISEENLRTTWGKAGWDITDLRPAHYHVNANVGDLIAALGLVCGPVPGDADRLQAPVWALHARRA